MFFHGDGIFQTHQHCIQWMGLLRHWLTWYSYKQRYQVGTQHHRIRFGLRSQPCLPGRTRNSLNLYFQNSYRIRMEYIRRHRNYLNKFVVQPHKEHHRNRFYQSSNLKSFHNFGKNQSFLRYTNLIHSRGIPENWSQNWYFRIDEYQLRKWCQHKRCCRSCWFDPSYNLSKH